jgi:hypothetical protein
MNLNFRKFKSSLLSLGLSATVSFGFGLPGFHAFAIDPIPTTRGAWRAALLSVRRYHEPGKRGNHAEKADTKARWLRLVALAPGPEGNEILGADTGVVELGDGFILINSRLVAKNLGRSKSCVNGLLAELTYERQPIAGEHRQVLRGLTKKPREWSLRKIKPQGAQDGGRATTHSPDTRPFNPDQDGAPTWDPVDDCDFDEI